jgi:hypothetical protein
MSNRLKIFLLLACIIMAVTSTVYSLPSGGRYIAYFADATFTDIVGERDLECGSGQWWEWGTRTPYYQTEGWSCDTGLTTSCFAYVCSGDHVTYDAGGHAIYDPGYCEVNGCNEW